MSPRLRSSTRFSAPRSNPEQALHLRVGDGALAERFEAALLLDLERDAAGPAVRAARQPTPHPDAAHAHPFELPDGGGVPRSADVQRAPDLAPPARDQS